MVWSSRRAFRSSQRRRDPAPPDEPSMFAPGELVIFVVGMVLLAGMLGYMVFK